MADITTADLVVTPGFGQNFLAWSYSDPNARSFSYLMLDKVEVWWSATNDRSTAVKVAEGLTSAYHVLTTGAAAYYWLRARDRGGNYGPWNPSSSTGGSLADATASIGGNGWIKLPAGVVQQWGSDSTGVTGTKTISFPIAFPTKCVNVEAVISGTFVAAALTISDFGVNGVTVNAKDVGGASVNQAFDWMSLGF